MTGSKKHNTSVQVSVRYRGSLSLRADALTKKYKAVGHREIPAWSAYGVRKLRNPLVTLEQEIAEIRARHAQNREYNRQARAALRVARLKAQLQGDLQNVTDHCALDESDA